ncbi:hypothetical protein BWP39_25015 [Paraburkholderia acidicola]|uniref:PDZ domain-containing protein n=1 Tax=Paraburkholderia acidicola TaxID=1912599 RepID=A0A2A4EQH8_9BURK|nr:aspartyl protease family protein [Paraburkholderia acidicola]PCE22947.1 hypothetical protein BWP39_25015 [Paraburkholderia acidicola]
MNMRVTRPVLLALLFLCSTAARSATIANSPHTAVLPLSIIDNRPFVGVTVDAKGPFQFILDTGSSSSTVSAALADSLKLPAVNTGTGTGAGEHALSFPVVHLDDLSVGPFSIGTLDAPAMDTSALSRAMGFQRFEGVLGVEIFQQHVLTLDAARQQLVIENEAQFKPPAGAIKVPFSLDENQMPLIEASVAGTTGLFQIDTGDRFSLTLFNAFWQAHALNEKMGRTVEAMTGYGGGGPIRGLVGRPTVFSIGGLALPAPVTRLSLQKAGAFTQTDRAGNIGMGILKRFRVSFDYGHHVMWLSKGPEFAASDRYDRSGMWLGLSAQGGLQVLDVVVDSPASAAGIRSGDLIEKVGPLRADASTLSKIRAALQAPDVPSVAVVFRRADGVTQTRVALADLISP